ncbi:MAG: MarR family transcriptional regulator [Anaerolineae bacterium]|nr:MarR family transcriptional regulator [Anaerolineae bacterium]
MAPTHDEIKALRNKSAGRVFLRLYRDFQVRCAPKLAARGHGNLSDAHLNVLIYLDSGGTRLVTLAERAQMTKQSMGDLIHDLEAQGYVEREKDSTDKRASIIRFTERGQQFLADAYEVKLEVEAEYRAILGDSAVEQFFDLAGKILEHAADEPIT